MAPNDASPLPFDDSAATLRPAVLATGVRVRRATTHQPLLNRELGILAFNERVLAQAADPAMPLLERLRFICITSSNLDEFFEVRMAGLQEEMRDTPGLLTPDGMSMQHAYTVIAERAHQLVHKQYAMLHETVLPALEKEGIVFLNAEFWN